jgi:hypothetical protein
MTKAKSGLSKAESEDFTKYNIEELLLAEVSTTYILNSN